MDKTIVYGIIIILVISGSFLLFNNRNKEIINDEPVILENQISSREAVVKEFNIKASRFSYAPDVIRVNKGDSVKIIIDNTDTLHGIRIPDLDLRANEVIEFTADEIGEFDFFCTNYCGEGHGEMGGKIIVE